MRSRIDPETGIDDTYALAHEHACDEYSHPNCQPGCPHPAHTAERARRDAERRARTMQEHQP